MLDFRAHVQRVAVAVREASRIASSKVNMVFIGGAPVSLDTQHKQLYEKYSQSHPNVTISE